MTTTIQDRAFIDAIMTDYLLESAIAWISSNLEPEEVFSDKQLETWAEDNGYEIKGAE